MDFALFVLLNGVLLLRPDDLVPELQGARLYLVVIVLNVLAAAPRLVDALRPAALAGRPITGLVIAYWAAGVASAAADGGAGPAQDFAGEFGKVVLYFLLLVGVVDSPDRLRAFFGWLVVLAATLTTLAILQLYGAIDVDALRPVENRFEVTGDGEVVVFDQLQAHGMFRDPNDLCLLLMIGSVAAGYRVATARSSAGAAGWLALVGYFAVAVVLTRSRGGALTLAGAVGALVWVRYGALRAAPLGLAAAAAGIAAGGRGGSLGAEGGDTAGSRVQLWSDGLAALLGGANGPLTLVFGIGPRNAPDYFGHVCHNSFVHAYVETGVVGGGLFATVVLLAGWAVYRVRPPAGPPDLARARPFAFAMLVGYAVGMYSLSRNYVVPTYLVLGVAAAYTALADPVGPPWFRVAAPLWKWAAVVAVVALAVLKASVYVLRAATG